MSIHQPGVDGPGHVALFTGGGDRPYALGLAVCLVSQGVSLDFIGSDELKAPEVCENPAVRFLNLRGDQSPDAPVFWKVVRVCRYYARLIGYAARARPRVFHVLWNNRFELFDRTVLMAYYRLLGKRVVLTVHNVNVGVRDGTDGLVNRLTLRMQYWLSDHLFVHTDKMRRELEDEFAVPARKVTVIPFGINTTVPTSAMAMDEARGRLGLDPKHKVLLFFGNIAPYKGLEYLIRAMPSVVASDPDCRLVIAGRPKGAESYWAGIQEEIQMLGLKDKIVSRIEYVADEDVETFFKAADVLVLPYTGVFQSGVLFLGYAFGLPAVVSDVGSLRLDVEDGVTGFVCRPRDPADLALTLQRYLSSRLFASRDTGRAAIRAVADQRHSWENVGAATRDVYQALWTSA